MNQEMQCLDYPCKDLMENADNIQFEKFKCQNKTGVGLFANLAASGT